MATLDPEYYKVSERRGVTVIQPQDRQIRDPVRAAQVGEELSAFLDREKPGRILLDLRKTAYMSSSAFAMLLMFAKAAAAAGSAVKICNMDPDVLVGANIIRLGEAIEIYEDESTALASF